MFTIRVLIGVVLRSHLDRKRPIFEQPVLDAVSDFGYPNRLDLRRPFRQLVGGTPGLRDIRDTRISSPCRALTFSSPGAEHSSVIDVNEDFGRGTRTRVGGFCLLGVELDEIQPPIRRLLILPKEANFGWVHAAIQVAMGWTNSHLHKFRFGDTTVSDPEFKLDEFEGDPPIADEGKVTLNDALSAKTTDLIYDYDFGDSWSHVVTLGKPKPSQIGIEGRALCLEGQRACPP